MQETYDKIEAAIRNCLESHYILHGFLPSRPTAEDVQSIETQLGHVLTYPQQTFLNRGWTAELTAFKGDDK
jgi:hypothetical protein